MSEHRYLEIMENALKRGERFVTGERTGVGRQGLWQQTVRFNLRDGYLPLLTTKRLSFRWIVEELRWFLSGSTYEPHLSVHGVDIWKEWATAEQCGRFDRPAGELGPVYGHQWRNFGAGPLPDRTVPVWEPETRRWINRGYDDNGFDQLAHLCRDIRYSPASTRLILSGWNPADADKVALPPCHTLYHVKVLPEGRLKACLYQRSCDLFLGVPFNIASYALLTHLLAYAHGCEAMELVHHMGDAHVYDNHHDQIREQLRRTPGAEPKLCIGDRLANKSLRGLLDMRYEDLTLEGYDPLPAIPAPVAV